METTKNRETSSNVSNSSANDRAGLDSIALVCLQALQRNQEGEKNDNDNKINTGSSTSTTTPHSISVESVPSSLPVYPPLPSMGVTSRVVSLDKIGVNDNGLSTSSQISKSCIPPLPTHPEMETHSNISVDVAVDSSSSAAAAATLSTLISDTTKKENPSSLSLLIPQVANFSQILADPEAWLQHTENMFGKLPPIEKLSGSNDIIVQPNDVLCGRGGETNHHPGNVQYRSLVKAYQKLYLLAKRREKPKIAQCIVVSVRGVGGRFLKRIKKSSLSPTTAEGPAWVDVGHIKAREKTSQALREGAPDLRGNVNTKNGVTNITATTNNAALNAAVRNAQVVAPHRREHTVAPSAQTAFDAMMNMRMPTSNFNHMNMNKSMNGSTSSSSPPFSYNTLIDNSHATSSSSESLSSSNVDKDALTAKAFTTAATNLMQHPIFQQLTSSQQQEAMLHELTAARASAKAATRTSTSSPSPSTNMHVHGRTSPTPMQSLYPNHHHQQLYPPHVHDQSYYRRDQYGHYHSPYGHYPPHDGKMNNSNDVSNTNNTTSTPPLNSKKVDLQSVYREVLIAKAAAVASASENTTKDCLKATEESLGNDKKRSASRLMSSPTIVSDTGSEESSSSSSITNNCDPLSSTSSNLKKNNSVDSDGKDNDVFVGEGKGGPRLKRFKSRLNNDSVN